MSVVNRFKESAERNDRAVYPPCRGKLEPITEGRTRAVSLTVKHAGKPCGQGAT